MKVLTEYLKFHTKTHRAYVHMTPQVEDIVRKSGVKEGMVLVSAMHITAGVYVNDDENGLHGGSNRCRLRKNLRPCAPDI